MERETFKDAFRDFMRLSYTVSDRPTYLRDISLGPLIIARIERGVCNIHYLFNGSRIYIPFEILDIMTCFNIWAQSLSFKSQDDIEEIGILLSGLCICLEKGISISDGDQVLESLNKIARLGYHKFSEYLESEFDIETPPIEYITLTKSINL